MVSSAGSQNQILEVISHVPCIVPHHLTISGHSLRRRVCTVVSIKGVGEAGRLVKTHQLGTRITWSPSAHSDADASRNPDSLRTVPTDLCQLASQCVGNAVHASLHRLWLEAHREGKSLPSALAQTSCLSEHFAGIYNV